MGIGFSTFGDDSESESILIVRGAGVKVQGSIVNFNQLKNYFEVSSS